MDAPRVHFCTAAGKGFSFTDAGAFELRDFDEPIRLYEVSWR